MSAFLNDGCGETETPQRSFVLIRRRVEWSLKEWDLRGVQVGRMRTTQVSASVTQLLLVVPPHPPFLG
jgi:hypothetical protein